MVPAYFKEGLVISIVFWAIGVVMLFGGYAALKPRTSSFPMIPPNKWQAVFVENGQVYFGKLANTSDEYLALSDVYYLRTASDLQQSATLNLVKLGGELHGPEDTIFIPKDSVLFWENLKDTSTVVQSISSRQ